MIAAAFLLLVGAVLSATLWPAMASIFAREAFLRENYLGRQVPTATGVMIPLVAVLGSGAIALVTRCVLAVSPTAFGGSYAWSVVVDRSTVLLLCLAFCLLGVVDDLAGAGESGGFRSHVRALLRGRLTTGGLKMVGAPLATLAILGGDAPSLVALIRSTLVICLCANLANLFDRRPGRVIKVGAVAFVGIAAAGSARYLGTAALAVGAAFGLLAPDLHQELMVGDAGSNVIGALVGYAVVVAAGPVGQWVVLAVVAVLNLASEFVSFSRVIESVAPLRWFDELGRR